MSVFGISGWTFSLDFLVNSDGSERAVSSTMKQKFPMAAVELGGASSCFVESLSKDHLCSGGKLSNRTPDADYSDPSEPVIE
jgi:hypothetical protein